MDMSVWARAEAHNPRVSANNARRNGSKRSRSMDEKEPVRDKLQGFGVKKQVGLRDSELSIIVKLRNNDRPLNQQTPDPFTKDHRDVDK